jgi:uncharacterized protein
MVLVITTIYYQPINTNNTMALERNPVGWFEIYVSDMSRAQAFYQAMLNVSLEPLPTSPEMEGSLEMLMFPTDMENKLNGAGGALCKMEGVNPGPGGTLIYFSCDDCAVEASRAGAAGGNVIRPKMSIGQYGFIALIMDTEGNMIGLHSIA